MIFGIYNDLISVFGVVIGDTPLPSDSSLSLYSSSEDTLNEFLLDDSSRLPDSCSSLSSSSSSSPYEK